MNLHLTYYVDSSPIAVEGALDRAISVGLDAAAELLTEERSQTSTETITHGIRVNGGLAALDGSEVHVSGTDRLTEVQITVPWSKDDAGSPKLWAATRFATVLTDEARVAA